MAPREIYLKRTGDGGLPHFWRGRLVRPDDLAARGFDRPELRSSLLVQLVCRGEDGNFEPLSANLGLDGRQRLNVCATAFSFVRITSAPPTAVIRVVFQCEILTLYWHPKKTAPN
jgi:hypothetical protein